MLTMASLVHACGIDAIGNRCDSPILSSYNNEHWMIGVRVRPAATDLSCFRMVTNVKPARVFRAARVCPTLRHCLYLACNRPSIWSAGTGLVNKEFLLPLKFSNESSTTSSDNSRSRQSNPIPLTSLSIPTRFLSNPQASSQCKASSTSLTKLTLLLAKLHFRLRGTQLITFFLSGTQGMP